MAKTRAQKIKIVENLSEKFSRAHSVVFADYKGLTMKQLSDLRNKLREVEAQFVITKNSLLKLALNTTNYQPPTTNISEGPIATLFSFEDEISPLKILAKVLKDASVGKIKGGFFNREFLDSLTIIRLSDLPGKQELYSHLVGSLSSPLYGMVGVLQADLRNLVYTLEQIKINRGGE